MITVVGMGCKNGDLTLTGEKAIKKASKVLVKTALTDTYKYFVSNKIDNQPLDFIFEQVENFDQLDMQIVEYVLEQEKLFGDVALCVNSCGSDDRSVALLAEKTNIQIVEGVARASLPYMPTLASISISAYELCQMVGFDYDTRCSLVVVDIDNAFVASEVKIILSNLIGEEEKVLWNGQEIELFELDRQKKYDYSCVLCCPPIQLMEKKTFNFINLYQIMRRLRGENGCPWDIAQTHESIRGNMIEEAYELVTAINNQDIENMTEETGDVVLQAIFHSVIGEDCGEYNWQDVMTMLCTKLITRHTHIFGDVVANNAEEALKAWDNAKTKEKKYTTSTSKMQGVAQDLPALVRALKIQKIAHKVGFDFEDEKQMLAKIAEEVQEFVEAPQDKKEDEGGDILFAVVNALRFADVNPEVALVKSIEKFAQRFAYVEAHCDGDIASKSMEYLDKLWEEAKLENCKH